MKRILTEVQKNTLNYIIEYYKEKSYTPTLKDISRRFNISIRAAYDRVQALIKKGYVDRDKGARTLIVKGEYINNDNFIPLLGQISAGTPLESPENIEFYLPLNQNFFPQGDYFALRVNGDSMIGAGIYDKDILIVKKQNYAKNRDIIVAMLDGETTVKRVIFEDKMVILKPENDKYPLIRRPYVKILGKVIALLRRFI